MRIVDFRGNARREAHVVPLVGVVVGAIDHSLSAPESQLQLYRLAGCPIVRLTRVTSVQKNPWFPEYNRDRLKFYFDFG